MKYIKTFESFDGEILNKDIIVYRSNDMKISNIVSGKVYFDTTIEALNYGESIFTNIIPKGLKCFDIDGSNKDQVIPQSIESNTKKVSEYLIKNGYDLAKRSTNQGIEYIVFNAKLPKDKFLFKYGWSDNFDYMAGEPCWFYFDHNNKEKYWILSPVGDEHDVDSEFEPYRHKYILFDVTASEMLKSFDSDEEALEWFNKNIQK